MALLCILGCRRPTTEEYHPLDPNVDAFLSFDTGSYWIYTDSVSGNTDSMAVIQFDNYIATEAGDKRYQTKFVRIGQFKSGESNYIFRWGYQTLWLSNYYDWNGYLDSIGGGMGHKIYTAIALVNINLIDDYANFIGNYSTGVMVFDSVYRFIAETLDGDTVIYHLRRRTGPLRMEYWQGGACKFNYKIINYHVNSVP